MVLIVVLTPSLAAVQLCAEDYMWWWRSYYRGASIGLYVLLYSGKLAEPASLLHHSSC